MDTEMCSDRVPRHRALTSVYLHCMKKKQQHSQHKEIQARECDPVTTSHWCCACCHNIKMCPLFLQHMVGACPVAATSTDSSLFFVTKSRKILPTEKASSLLEKDDLCFALFAPTAVSHVSSAALLQTAGW